MSITLEQAKNLHFGQVLTRDTHLASTGRPQRWRVNGKPQTWKTRPDEVRVPVKWGLYVYDSITENDLDDYSLTEVDNAD